MRNAAPVAPLPTPYARAAGPLLTAALAAVIELLAGTPLHVPNPPALFVLAVVLAAFSGGIGPGLISAAIGWAYTAYFFSDVTAPFEYDGENLRRVVVWAFVMPLIALMVGLLKRRAAREEALKTSELAEASLRESEARFRKLVDEGVPAVITIVQGNQLVYTNTMTEQFTGYTRAELLNMNFWDVARADYKALVRERGLARQRGDAAPPPRYEFPLVTKTGDERWLDLSVTRIEFAGKPSSLAVGYDITERKRAEALLEGQKRILERIAVGRPLDDVLNDITQLIEGQAPGMLCSVLLLDDDGLHVRHGAAPSLPATYVSAIDGAAIGPRVGSCGTAMYFRKPVIVTDILEDPLWEDYRHLAAPHGLRACWSTPLLAHDGRVLGSFAMYYRHVRSPSPAETRLVEVAANLAGLAIERKRAEEAVQQSREQYRTLARNFPDGFVLLFDKELKFLIADGAGLATIGLSREAIEGRTLAESASEAVRILEPIYRGALAGRESRQEFPHAGRVYSLIVVPVRDHAGEIGAALAVYLDVTELKRLEEQLRHAQKMEAVGRLAGGVAHDFNNLLTVINGCSELVVGGLAANDPNRELLGEVRKAGDRAAHLTQQLLAFSRKQMLQPQMVSLNDLLRDLLKLLHRLIGEDIELALVPDATLGLAKIDPGHFEQAVINLAVNARDAMPDGGRLTIETHNTDLDLDSAERYADVAPGRYVRVAVHDSGQGMDPSTKARIFEPFFTTKEPGKGTGLGLAMVYGFVKQSGGHIEVHSEPGRGTTFELYLPRAEEAALSETAAAHRDAPKGTETILLVEDEESVRGLVRRVLAANGYMVLEAQDGPGALAVARGHCGPIHLLVSDLVMPRMNGRQLAVRLAKERPRMRILFMSGYSDDAGVGSPILGAGDTFLQKPFSPIGLARKIREVLDADADR